MSRAAHREASAWADTRAETLGLSASVEPEAFRGILEGEPDARHVHGFGACNGTGRKLGGGHLSDRSILLLKNEPHGEGSHRIWKTRTEPVARDNDTEIRRRTHRYSVRRLTRHAAVESGPTALHVEAAAIDLQRLVVVRYVDFRTGYPETAGGVVKFSAKGESPDVKRNIRLATPADFRESGYEPGIVDDLDAAQQADMAPYLTRYLSRKGSYVAGNDISASATFAATEEPWVYCTSIMPTRSYGTGSLGALKNEFAKSKGSDVAITAIDDPRLFARRLGVELALAVEGGKDVEDNYAMEMLDRELARRVCGLDSLPPVDAVVWVNHGPVHYEQRQLVIETESEMPTMGALRVWFTKRPEFSGQREYRFAVRFTGEPRSKAILLQTSDELLRMTRPLDGGGR